jgi:hypothetical protein
VILREGSNGFTCMPGNPNVVGEPPMGVDAASMQWFADAKAHKPKPTNTVPGITYMLAGWTCLPGFPGAAHDEPGCFDQVFLQFIKETSAGRTPNVQRVGISYMDGGKWVPNKSHCDGKWQ